MDLIDTSVWVEFLRDTGSAACDEVERMYRERPADLATTEPVIMELLAGAGSDRAFEKLEKLTSGLPILAVDSRLDYRDAAIACRAARARGKTVRKLIDCLIAVVAVRTGAVLVHRDRDFDALAAVLPDLRVRSLL